MQSLNRKGASKPRALLRLEMLEERVTPATFNVTNNNDTGNGSLRDAITQANAAAGNDVITFNASLGTITLNSQITITGGLAVNGRPDTIVDGGSSTRLFRITTGGQVSFSGLTLQNGFTGSDEGGGAIVNISSQLTLNGVVFIGNQATTTTTNATVNLAGFGGGAVSNFQSGTLTVNDCTFSTNTAALNGGAILQRSTGVLIVRRSTFVANLASGGTGGAISYTNNSITSDIVNSTFQGNTASNGGALGATNRDFTINGLIRVTNCTITQNTANGALGNTVFGGGISSDLIPGSTNFQLNSNVIAQNLDPNGSPSDLSGGFNTASAFNFVGSSRGILNGVTNGVNGNIVGGSTAATIIDPDLGPLQNNGGINLTRSPNTTSPLIDAGDPNANTNIVGNTDQRSGSFPRISNGRIDIGSIEFFVPPPPPPPPPDPNNPTPPPPPPPAPPPPPILNPNERIAVGSGFGAVSSVIVFASNAFPIISLNPFPGFTGGVRTATGDLNGDLVDDIVVAAGPGGGPAVVVYDGVTFRELSRFFAYAETFDGGVYVALGTLSRNGSTDLTKDIITGAGAGGGPHVKGFDGRTGALLSSFFATDPTSTFGVSIATLDLDADGIDEIATANAVGGSPVVRIVTGLTGRQRLSFLAYQPNYLGGVSLAAADLNGDGIKELITGSATQSSHVIAYDLTTGQQVSSFFAYSPLFNGGVQVSTSNFDADNTSEIVTVSGAGSSGHLRIVQRDTSEVSSTFTFDFGFLGGAFVG